MLSTLKYAGASKLVSHTRVLANNLYAQASRLFSSQPILNDDPKKSDDIGKPSSSKVPPTNPIKEPRRGKSNSAFNAALGIVIVSGLGAGGYFGYKKLQEAKKRSATKQQERALVMSQLNEIKKREGKELVVDVKNAAISVEKQEGIKKVNIKTLVVKVEKKEEKGEVPKLPGEPVVFATEGVKREMEGKKVSEVKVEEGNKITDKIAESAITAAALAVTLPPPLPPSPDIKPPTTESLTAQSETLKTEEEKKPEKTKKEAEVKLPEKERKELQIALEKGLNDAANYSSSYIKREELPTWKIEPGEIFTSKPFKLMESFSISAVTSKAKERIKSRLKLSDKIFHEDMNELVLANCNNSLG